MGKLNTIPRTSSLKEAQKGKDEKLNSNKTIIEKIESSISIITPILTDSFGCDGLAVFLQKNNGSLSITKSGIDIINTLFKETQLSDQMSHYLLEQLNKYFKNVGDGCKRFIFYTKSIIKLLNRDRNFIGNRISQLKKLHFVLNKSENEFFITNKDCGVLNLTKLSYLSSSYFNSRFTSHVSSIFSKLVNDWILFYHSYKNIVNLDKKVIQYMLDNIHIISVNNIKSLALSESTCKNGLVVNGKVKGNLNKLIKNNQCLLKVYLYPEEDSINIKEFESIIFGLITETKSEMTTQIILVTNNILSDGLSYLLRLNNIIGIEGVSVDMVKFLLRKSESIVEFDCLSDYDRIWLSIPGISQLNIYSPTKDLSNELKESVINYLTVLKFSLINNNVLYDRDRNFEILFYYNILSEIKNSSNLKPPIFINNRNELLKWHKMTALSRNSSVFNLNKLTDNVLPDRSKLISFVTYMVSSIKEQFDDNFLEFFSNILYYLLGKFNKTIDDNNSFVELVSVKLCSLNYSISLILNMYNIDQVLCASTKDNFKINENNTILR